MHRRLRRLTRGERGFTLVELLITILIVGLLAAIAIAMFASQTKKADDATAKSDARTLVTFMHACHVQSEDFTKCATKADTEADGIDWGTGPGEVSVVNTTPDSYEIEAVSKAKTNGSHHVFTIARTQGSNVERTCTGGGGCRNGTW